ncbi:RepB family plasmid replication initiator protein, partial [Pseudomonas helleri]|nr:RepB family plasmid replication initiator protein [Pseudomonas helleri]
VELRFSKDMLPYLTELSREFTKYALADVVRMDSSHAIRLYELLMQWDSTGERVIAVADLRHWLQLEERYPLTADLRRWVIEPAIAQINEHSPL